MKMIQKLTKYQKWFMRNAFTAKVLGSEHMIVDYRCTLSLKSLERKGFIKILKYRTTPDRRHYETVIKITIDIAPGVWDELQ